MRHYKRCAEAIHGHHHMAAYERDARADFLAYRHEQLAAERAARELTPYPGPNGSRWAIPWSIVACESGGDFGAYNPGYEPDGPGSGPGGAYQIILSTWHAHGGSGYPRYAPPDEQHRVAASIWAGGAGRGQWAC